MKSFDELRQESNAIEAHKMAKQESFRLFLNNVISAIRDHTEGFDATNLPYPIKVEPDGRFHIRLIDSGRDLALAECQITSNAPNAGFTVKIGQKSISIPSEKPDTDRCLQIAEAANDAFSDWINSKKTD